MKNQIIHTPEGVRDIYNVECRKKLILQERLHDVLHLYGYQDIQTPSFEFFEVFRKEIGTIASKELYKFFARTLRLPLPVRQQLCMKERNFLYGFVILGIRLSIIPVIRDV